MTFCVIQCSKCGMWNTKQITDFNKSVFRCHYCGHTVKLKKKREVGLALEVIKCVTARQALLVCQANNKERGEKNADDY